MAVGGALAARGEAPEAVRDGLSAQHLLAAARAAHPDADPVAFTPAWWDGAALVPSLVFSTEGRRLRIADAGAGRAIVLPRSAFAARRALARVRHRAAGSASPPRGAPRHVMLTSAPPSPRRRLVAASEPSRGQLPLFPDAGPTPDPVPPPRPQPQSTGRTVEVVQAYDYRVCRYADCGGITPIPSDDDEPCPLCGRS